jgi:hypothetical protein
MVGKAGVVLFSVDPTTRRIERLVGVTGWWE